MIYAKYLVVRTNTHTRANVFIFLEAHLLYTKNESEYEFNFYFLLFLHQYRNSLQSIINQSQSLLVVLYQQMDSMEIVKQILLVQVNNLLKKLITKVVELIEVQQLRKLNNLFINI